MLMIQAKVLRRREKVVRAKLVGYFHWRLSCQNGVKVKLFKDAQLQVFCFGKAICQLNVYCGNPRDGCYFDQDSNDKRKKAKDDQDGLLPRLLFFGGHGKSRFEWLRKVPV